jgi:sugar phosphate isomerase/epimerase
VQPGDPLDGALSLCWGTLQEADFGTLVAAAAGAGFRAVTLNTVLCEDARRAGLSPADIAVALADHGLVVSDIDPTPGWPPEPLALPGEEFFARLSRGKVGEVFELAHAVGTDLVNAPAIFSGTDSLQRITDAFGELCLQAAENQLRVCLEFMPITPVPDLPTAAGVLAAVNAPNAGVLLDCWHFRRTGGKVTDLALLPADRYFALQLDDVLPAPLDDVNEETLNHRLLPGEGAGEVVEILQALKDMGAALCYDVEVFNEDLRSYSFEERARLNFQASKRVLDQLR